MKTIDERELQKQQKKNKQRQKGTRVTETIVKWWELNGFIVQGRLSPVNI